MLRKIYVEQKFSYMASQLTGNKCYSVWSVVGDAGNIDGWNLTSPELYVCVCVLISPPENFSKKLQKLCKFLGKIVLNFDKNCAKKAIIIYYIDNASACWKLY